MFLFTFLIILPEFGFRLVMLENVLENDVFENKRKCISSLRTEISMIKMDCGEVCETVPCGENVHRQGKYFAEIRKEYSCDEIFESPILDRPSSLCSLPVTLKEMPEDILKEFTYGERVTFLDWFINEVNWTTDDKKIWTKQYIETLRNDFVNGVLIGSYGAAVVQAISTQIDQYMHTAVNGRHVLVVGTQIPWIEAILLEKGARWVTTLEYASIESQHPNISVISPDTFRKMYHNKTFHNHHPFDAVVTYSTLEHSGLGRYGDPINPWGDLITMAKILCVMKKGAMALVGIPTYFPAFPEKEVIGWNIGKLYGKIQLSHLFANWNQVYTDAIEKFDTTRGILFDYQPIYILQKP